MNGQRPVRVGRLLRVVYELNRVFRALCLLCFFFSSRRRHTSSVSAFMLNRSSDLFPARTRKVNANNSAALTGRSTPLIMFSLFFFFSMTGPAEFYTLSLHDALPI